MEESLGVALSLSLPCCLTMGLPALTCNLGYRAPGFIPWQLIPLSRFTGVTGVDKLVKFLLLYAAVCCADDVEIDIPRPSQANEATRSRHCCKVLVLRSSNNNIRNARLKLNCLLQYGSMVANQVIDVIEVAMCPGAFNVSMPSMLGINISSDVRFSATAKADNRRALNGSHQREMSPYLLSPWRCLVGGRSPRGGTLHAPPVSLRGVLAGACVVVFFFTEVNERA